MKNEEHGMLKKVEELIKQLNLLMPSFNVALSLNKTFKWGVQEDYLKESVVLWQSNENDPEDGPKESIIGTE